MQLQNTPPTHLKNGMWKLKINDKTNNTPEIEQVLMKQLNTWLTQDTPGWTPKDRKSGKPLSAPAVT